MTEPDMSQPYVLTVTGPDGVGQLRFSAQVFNHMLTNQDTLMYVAKLAFGNYCGYDPYVKAGQDD
jgi:hypothetical protein